LKLKSAQSDNHGGQINFVRRIVYRYGDTYTGKQGVTDVHEDVHMASLFGSSTVRSTD